MKQKSSGKKGYGDIHRLYTLLGGRAVITSMTHCWEKERHMTGVMRGTSEYPGMKASTALPASNI